MLAEYYSPHHSIAMADLTLWCLVEGESTSSAFPVEIAAAKAVYQLKKVIKKEKSPEFDDITANKLTLWKVSLPLSPSQSRDRITVESLPKGSANELFPPDILSDIFDNPPPERTVHIIVQYPLPGNASHC